MHFDPNVQTVRSSQTEGILLEQHEKQSEKPTRKLSQKPKTQKPSRDYDSNHPFRIGRKPEDFPLVTITQQEAFADFLRKLRPNTCATHTQRQRHNMIGRSSSHHRSSMSRNTTTNGWNFLIKETKTLYLTRCANRKD